jgi:hypothetical protein
MNDSTLLRIHSARPDDTESKKNDAEKDRMSEHGFQGLRPFQGLLEEAAKVP